MVVFLFSFPPLGFAQATFIAKSFDFDQTLLIYSSGVSIYIIFHTFPTKPHGLWLFYTGNHFSFLYSLLTLTGSLYSSKLFVVILILSVIRVFVLQSLLCDEGGSALNEAQFHDEFDGQSDVGFDKESDGESEDESVES